MLSLLGFLTVAVFLYLIMTKRLSVLMALVVVPTVFGFLGGFGAGIGNMMLEGIKKVAPTGIMVGFAVLYFGLMIDNGMFDPIISRIIRMVKGDPLKIMVLQDVKTVFL